MQKTRVALFIDAENASPGHLPNYLEHCRALGKPTIARCYGSATALKGWEESIARHHLIPVQTPPGASKANASDFALTIDAVAMLHRNLFDHAVIASSDADFTLLAVHIREHGKGIDGIGEAKAKASLKSAFDQFVVVSKPEAPTVKPAAKKAAAPKVPAKPATRVSSDNAWIVDVFDSVRKSADNCDLQALGRALAAKNNDYKKGFRTLDNFLRKSGLFEIRDKNVYRLPAGR